jgi:hypothetical protein
MSFAAAWSARQIEAYGVACAGRLRDEAEGLTGTQQLPRTG